MPATAALDGLDEHGGGLGGGDDPLEVLEDRRLVVVREEGHPVEARQVREVGVGAGEVLDSQRLAVVVVVEAHDRGALGDVDGHPQGHLGRLGARRVEAVEAEPAADVAFHDLPALLLDGRGGGPRAAQPTQLVDDVAVDGGVGVAEEDRTGARDQVDEGAAVLEVEEIVLAMGGTAPHGDLHDGGLGRPT